MSAPEALFRREALDYHTGDRGPGEVVRVAPAWTVWMYRLLLLLVLAGVAVTFVVRTPVTVSAPAVVDVPRQAFTALVPVASSAEVRLGERVRIEVDGDPGGWLVARAKRARAAEAPAARSAGFAEPGEAAVLVEGDVLSPAAELPEGPRTEGHAIVVVGSRPVATAFADDLRQMLGDGGQR